MDKLEYLAKTLSRTTRKDYENYLVNAVWNRLEDPGLRPVSQQWLARPDGGGYFIDLYFPQLNIGVECDEPYHEGQREKDRERELDLIDILNAIDDRQGYRALHVRVEGYESTERQIDAAVDEIRAEAARRRSADEFEPWEPEKVAAGYYLGKDRIAVGDQVGFRTIREACNALFGTSYESDLRRCYFTPRGPMRDAYGKKYKVWFPAKVTPQGRGNHGWVNKVSEDGSCIYERREEGGTADDGRDTHQRVTFIKARDPITGRAEYRFLGVFEPAGKTSLDDGEYRVFKRVSDNVPVLGASD